MKTAEETFEDIKIADPKGRIGLGVRFAGQRFAVQRRPDGATILTPVVIIPETERPLTNRRLSEIFAPLASLNDDWDGRGSLAPIPTVLAFARETLVLLQAGGLGRGVAWTEPHIGVNERGQITMEWWRRNRALTIFVRAEGEVDYLKSWGVNIVKDMEDGELTRIADFVALSRWLHEGDAAER